MSLRRITREECTITVTALDEDLDYRKEYDAEVVEGIAAAIEYDNLWGWCCIRVDAVWTLPGHPDYLQYKGSAYLGGCSYRSEEDFTEGNSDYYDALVEEAISDLNDNIMRVTTHVALIRSFLTESPTNEQA